MVVTDRFHCTTKLDMVQVDLTNTRQDAATYATRHHMTTPNDTYGRHIVTSVHTESWSHKKWDYPMQSLFSRHMYFFWSVGSTKQKYTYIGQTYASSQNICVWNITHPIYVAFIMLDNKELFPVRVVVILPIYAALVSWNVHVTLLTMFAFNMHCSLIHFSFVMPYYDLDLVQHW